MSTGTILQITTDSSEATENLAVKLGERLRGGEVIELRSDVGGGKTTFVHGLARGMRSLDPVSSPSFTLSRVYKGMSDAKNGPVHPLWLHHYDFYRLAEPGIMVQELGEVLTDDQAVVVVEWADIVEDVLPSPRIIIRITAPSEQQRQFVFEVDDAHAYILEGLKT